MKIQILQRGGSKEQYANIEEAARFYAKELLSTRLANTLTIRIACRAGLSKDLHGKVTINSNGSKAQKTFNITLQRDEPIKEQLLTLAHEFVHVEQRARGRLQYRYWKTTKQLHARWECNDLGGLHLIPYAEQPWEVEARHKAPRLLRRYANA